LAISLALIALVAIPLGRIGCRQCILALYKALRLSLPFYRLHPYLIETGSFYQRIGQCRRLLISTTPMMTIPFSKPNSSCLQTACVCYVKRLANQVRSTHCQARQRHTRRLLVRVFLECAQGWSSGTACPSRRNSFCLREAHSSTLYFRYELCRQSPSGISLKLISDRENARLTIKNPCGRL
jgi:hypothetical protein